MGRWERLAPLLLFISAATRLSLIPLNSIESLHLHVDFDDLHVYVLGGAALDRPGSLYDFVYTAQTPGQPLPFTYPPFAAIVFYPLHWLPFAVVGLCWQLATVAAVYGVVRVSQRLLGGRAGEGRRVGMLWTAVAMWLEPLRSTIELGQIGVFLTLAVLYAAYSSRWWLSGLLVGLAAGVKLTPAVAGLYLVGVRRWGAAVFSAVVFAASVGVSFLVLGSETRRYFTAVVGDTGRVGPIGTSFNQSWRGGISRIVGHDAGFGPLVIGAIAVTAVLALMAWRALGVGGSDRDQLGSLLVVEFFGLLVSPISWTHHWVWVVPLIIWLIHGPWREVAGARVLGWCWLALTLIGGPNLLALAQPSVGEISRPWYLAWAGLIYIVATLMTLGWIAATGPRVRRTGPARPGPNQVPASQSA